MFLEPTLYDQLSARRFGRVVFAVVMALALYLQSYAIQTHIHGLNQPHTSSAAQEQKVASTTNSGKHQLPTKDDSDNCQLCHSLYAGQYLTPSLAAYLQPTLAVSIIVFLAGFNPHYDAASHSWHGRGPPQI